MKKILVLLAVIATIFPYSQVFAFNIYTCSTSQPCYKYSKGMVVNFYRSEKEATDKGNGVSAITISDEGETSQTVKVLWGQIYESSVSYAGIEEDGSILTDAKTAIVSLNRSAGYLFDENFAKLDNAAIPSLNDFANALDGYYEAGVWTFNAEKYGPTIKMLTAALGNKKGFYTSQVSTDGTEVTVIDLTYDAAGNITAITSKKVSTSTNEYAVILTLPVNKTYECVDRNEASYACYSCNDEYIWTKVGSQAETCALVTNVASKSKCSKNPKTGIKEYAIELTGVIALCAVALVIAKKKDLFKAI